MTSGGAAEAGSFDQEPTESECVDIAHKVVGVGSVGTRAWILLLEGGVETEVLLLQAKQAGPSVLAGYAGESEYRNNGERVVAGQHLMQATSDIFLGWLRARPTGGRWTDYHLQQLRDWTLSADIEEMIPAGMQVYAQLCGWTLAAPTPVRAIGFVSPHTSAVRARFDNAVADFAEAYADQNERDQARTGSRSRRWTSRGAVRGVTKPRSPARGDARYRVRGSAQASDRWPCQECGAM